jgi:hypothetical protein
MDRPPTWSAVPSDTNLTEGDDYNFTIIVMDPDEGDVVTYWISVYPACNLSLNSTTGQILWSNVTVGYYQCNLSAISDRSGLGRYFNLTVIAKPPPVNHPPKIQSVMAPNNTNVNSTATLTFSVDAVDADGDNLTYDWQENGVTLSRERTFSRKFSLGDHQLVLSIGDGQKYTNRTFNFTVLPPPKTPRTDTGPITVPGFGTVAAGAAVAAVVAIGLFWRRERRPGNTV